MVPLGNVAFTFPFMPEHQPLHSKDIVGLLLIMSGLFVYRFVEDLLMKWGGQNDKSKQYVNDSSNELKKALMLFENGEPTNETKSIA